MKDNELLTCCFLIRRFKVRIYANPRIFAQTIAMYEEWQKLFIHEEEKRTACCKAYHSQLRKLSDDLRYEAHRIFDTDAEKGFGLLYSMANEALKIYEEDFQREAA